jgi:hypothetical protein
MVQTGFAARPKGKTIAQTLVLGSGGIVDGVTGIASKPLVVARLAMTVTATANTDFTLSVPPGATLFFVKVYTGTAFTAATDAQISIGISAGDASYVAPISIKPVNALTLPLLAAAAAALASAPAGSPNLFIRIVQTGAPSAVGAATLAVFYVMP